ncbi:hypothetical protein GGI23_000091 [Coemansia sp. RSA 2559]|nr:hypothetical protein GGI23_000091 [Coemansia sp. RSA 2559]KAJ2869013.1 hypothetical protein GGI22_000520 [Coemansia erecta]
MNRMATAAAAPSMPSPSPSASPTQSPARTSACAAGSTEHSIADDGDNSSAKCSQEETPKRPASDKERKYACLICDKRFTRPSSLACHRRTHTGEKPHMCMFPGCGKQFSVQSNLRRHMRIHEKTLLPTPLASGSISTASSTPLLGVMLPQSSPSAKVSASNSSGGGKAKRKAKRAKANSRKHKQVPSNAPTTLDICGLPKSYCMPASSSVGSLQPMTTTAIAHALSPLAIVPSNAGGNDFESLATWQSAASTLLPMSSSVGTPSATNMLGLYQQQQQTCGLGAVPMTAPAMHPGFSHMPMRPIRSSNQSRSPLEALLPTHKSLCGPASAGIHPLQYHSYPLSAQPNAVFALASPAATDFAMHPPPVPSLLLAPCTPAMALPATPYSAMHSQQQQQQQPAVAARVPELPYSAFGLF